MTPSPAADERARSALVRALLEERPKLALRDLWLLVPLLAAIVFVAHFASPIGESDEWLFLDAELKLEGVDLSTREGLEQAREIFPLRLSEHLIAVPFLVYHAVSEATHYDSRVFMYLTVALFALQAWIFRKRIIPSTWAVLPVIVLLFSPSHYTEFLWGWQYTLGMSIAFSLVALWILDGVSPASSLPRQAAGVAACLFCCTAGMFSAACGMFAFPAAALLVALKPFGRIRKACWIGVILLAGIVLYREYMIGSDRNIGIAPSMSLHFLTALGGSIFSLPHFEIVFGFDALTATGLVILAASVAIVVRAARIGALGDVALPLSIAALGYAWTATTAASRTWLGNWHLQMALPALCGMYAAGWRVWRADRTRASSVPFFTMFGVFVLGLFGWGTGWLHYAPVFQAHHEEIEDFARRYLDEPELRIPYAGVIHLTPELILFLSAKGHPAFDKIEPPRSSRPIPDGTRAYIGSEEVALPLLVENVGKARMLTVAVPASAKARGVVAKIGTSTVVMRPIKARHNLVRCCREEDTRCFAGLILSEPLRSGPQVVELTLFD